MILADSSIWISHLNKFLPDFNDALRTDKIVTHPMVIGEIMCGHVKNRDVFLEKLFSLESAPEVTHEAVYALIENFKLMGHGLSFVDIHLLASCRVTGYELWTQDKKLAAVFRSLKY